MSKKSETAYQLFNRLSSRPSLSNLHPDIFPDAGPQHNSIIQISGAQSTGKSLLLAELLVRCIMPKRFTTTALPGKAASAILINTDHHVTLIQIISLIERFLREYHIPTEHHQEIITASLAKLTVMNVYCGEQLEMTIRQIEHLLSENFDIAFICIDSLSAYYWYERYVAKVAGTNVYTLNMHCNKLLKLLKEIVDDRKVVCAFSRFQTDTELVEFCDYSIKLTESECSKFMMVLHDYTNNIEYRKKYSIHDFMQFTQFTL